VEQGGGSCIAQYACVGRPRFNDDVRYIMETFLIVKRKDEAEHHECRTKRVILEIYDEMKHAIATGRPYHTRFDPPPRIRAWRIKWSRDNETGRTQMCKAAEIVPAVWRKLRQL
jgi:hypothetical protein